MLRSHGSPGTSAYTHPETLSAWPPFGVPGEAGERGGEPLFVPQEASVRVMVAKRSSPSLTFSLRNKGFWKRANRGLQIKSGGSSAASLEDFGSVRVTTS